MYSINTKYPVAVDSPDHLHPKGTANDNNSWPRFIAEMGQRFGRKLRVLDLGCSGGQFVADFLAAGHHAVGIEGSDYSLKAGRANWPELAGSHLFTADISQPFEVLWNGSHTIFDIITAVEVLEHIPEDRLEQVFVNISAHLAGEGLFVASIGTKRDTWQGVELHQTVQSADWWLDRLKRYFQVLDEPGITNWPRHKHPHSLSVALRRR
jgi:SAM-dependent methyltransferase